MLCLACPFIGKLNILFWMCAADKVWINDRTLIHKNIRSVRNLHAQELTDVKIIGQCDVTDKHNNVSFEDLDVHYH